MLGNEALDNPVWASLKGNHRHLAIGGARVRRYPREVGPFVAVSASGQVEDGELLNVIAEDEEVYIVGAIPELPPALRVLARSPVLQMVCGRPISIDQPLLEIRPLLDGDAGAMLELTALVYPFFFRSRTSELGRYFGRWEGRQLAAMAGERMSAGKYRELSGVCTHPEFVRRGYARSLIAHVVNMILAEGNLAFLHVDADNETAQELYRRLGFVDANVVPMVHLRRVGL